METKSQVEALRLLEARHVALKDAEKHLLRPLGKLWGMDVFTWLKPNKSDLSATLQTFPFPVFWLANAETILELNRFSSETLNALSWIGQYGNKQMSLDGLDEEFLSHRTVSNSLDEAFNRLIEVKRSRHIVLFTASGENAISDLEHFESLVKLHA